MYKNISKRNIILAVVFLVLIVSVFVFFLIKKKQTNPTVENKPSKVQQISVINALNAENKLNPVTASEKNKIIKELEVKNAKNKPLTEEEKAAIMKSLGN